MAKSSSQPIKSDLLAWVFKRNIRLSFASRSQAAQLSAIALDITCLFRNRSLGQVLHLRTLGSPAASLRGQQPGTVLTET
jgi:hypothetical protein